jgi:hypothetical protein
MRITLSAADSRRWASSPEEAYAVEETVLQWAADAHIEDPVVVVTHDGKTAFAFTVDRGDA